MAEEASRTRQLRRHVLSALAQVALQRQPSVARKPLQS